MTVSLARDDPVSSSDSRCTGELTCACKRHAPLHCTDNPGSSLLSRVPVWMRRYSSQSSSDAKGNDQLLHCFHCMQGAPPSARTAGFFALRGLSGGEGVLRTVIDTGGLPECGASAHQPRHGWASARFIVSGDQDQVGMQTVESRTLCRRTARSMPGWLEPPGFTSTAAQPQPWMHRANSRRITSALGHLDFTAFCGCFSRDGNRASMASSICNLGNDRPSLTGHVHRSQLRDYPDSWPGAAKERTVAPIPAFTQHIGCRPTRQFSQSPRSSSFPASTNLDTILGAQDGLAPGLLAGWNH
ncbi:hypothetical protein C2E23DRAFT_224525 [Lenzites betulinus]|nr:hypothetical protein C2E23DRAFT_224525 [Lenzites betulinus]